MITSHRHRFIFIRTIKTASTTVEIFLRHYCGPDDVVTPLYADEEALADPDGNNGPRNYGRSCLAPWKVRRKDLRSMRAHRRYPCDDRSEIDFFIRYETLQTDLEELRDRLGLGGEVNLVQAKSGIRLPRSSPRELLTEQQAKRIAELAHNEIEMFGYRWDGPEPPDNDS